MQKTFALLVLTAITSTAVAPLAARTGHAAGDPAEAGYGLPIRLPDRRLLAAVISASAGSDTFRALLDALRARQAIVYVRWAPGLSRRLEGVLWPQVTVAGGVRYLQVGLRHAPVGERLIGVLAHELQHAIEALDSGAETPAGVLSWFREAGDGVPRRVYETKAAIDTGERVESDLRDRIDKPVLQILRDREVKRTQHVDPAIQRALVLVGQQLNPVEVVDAKLLKEHYQTFRHDLDATHLEWAAQNIAAFRYPQMSDPRIFVNAGAKLYRDAAKRPRNPVARLNLARTLVHEQIHNTEWDDDEGEYAAKRKEADWYREQLTRARLSHRDSQAAQEELKVLETRAQAAEKNARRTRDRKALARELEK